MGSRRAGDGDSIKSGGGTFASGAVPYGASDGRLTDGPDTDALHILGRTAIGSWVGADRVDIGHYDYRASATGYALSTNAAGTATLLSCPSGSGVLYLQLAASFAQGWTIGDTPTATAHLRPQTNNTFDIGSGALMIRDVYVGRNLELDGALNHDGTTVGFYGAVPVVQAAMTAAGTDAATTQTLANALRTMAINLGLMASA